MRIIFLMTKCHDFSKGMRIFYLVVKFISIGIVVA